MAVALSHYASGSQRRLDLIERSLQKLRAGKLHEAYVLADMSCRSRVPAPEDLLLRGEIAARLGFEGIAHDDLEDAFAIDPSLASAQLRMLAALQRQGDGDAADAMARAFLRVRPQPAVLRAALAALRLGPGVESIAWSQTSRATLKVHIFSRARQDFHIGVDFGEHAERLLVQTGTSHALAAVRGAASSFEIAWPQGGLTARFNSDPPLDWTGAPAFRPLYPMRPISRRQPAQRAGPAGSVTIIIPVYADIEMTRACIDSVLASRSSAPERIVLVDDCGPDPALRALLADYARQPDVELIANPVNLGFIGSVNRALMHYPDGDVILLNADTIVASGWVERLSRAAYSRAKVGTVTPLSNNGELTSLPAPFEVTSLPSASHVAAIDATLSELNRGQTIDLPNGVGFCLYITDACRRRTGILNDLDYQEGYLEEVDYCLRASELGFEHICACDVFVGHAGGQSFQTRKRGLVKHNLAQLERFFPAIKAMTHRFVRADPLQSLRIDLQKQLLAKGIVSGEPVTLVIGRRAIPAVGEPDLPSVASLAREGPLLRLSFMPSGQATLHRDGAMAPYRLPLEQADVKLAADLLDCIRAHRIDRIVYLDGHHPGWARGLPRLLAVDYDVRATDDSILAPPPEQASGEAVNFEAWASFVGRARHFASPSTTFSELAESRGLPRPVHEPLRLEPLRAEPLPLGHSARIERGATGDLSDGVAVFLDEFDIQAWRWVQDLGRTIIRQRSTVRLVVFGATVDDDGLRRTGNVTVTGMPTDALAATTFALHRCLATIALIPASACEHASLGAILQSPRPLLTWNPYLPDVLHCNEGEAATFEAGQPVEAVFRALEAARGSAHGRY